MIANCDEIFKTSGLGFHDTPRSPIATGKTGKPNVHMFLMKKRRRIKIPKNNGLKLFLKIKTECKNTSMGSHIIVGFIEKTKTEKAKRRVVFLFPAMSSFKIISEKIITGRSGLGD
jgi:hypothetical protein